MIKTYFRGTILSILILCVVFVLTSCNEQPKTNIRQDSSTVKTAFPKPDSSTNNFAANIVAEIGSNIISIFQDKNNNYWFGTQNMGVYRYDGKSIIHFTQNDGLSGNQINTIQEDNSGNVWLETGFGVSRFDGKKFTTFPDNKNLQLSGSSEKEWKISPDDLLFNAGGGVYRWNGNSFTYLPLPKTDSDDKSSQSTADRLGPYGVYCSLKDKKGNFWFGTQTMGVCRFDGKTFTWFTEKGLSGPAIRGLFEDRNGNLWFGNNGNGLLRFDGKTLTNFTEEKGLANHEFVKTGKQGPGTLARVWTINEDNNGDLFIGTFDAGVWRYDGKTLINYTIKDGLTSEVINTIYKDKKGELWFGTGGDGVCKFNGKSFTKFSFK